MVRNDSNKQNKSKLCLIKNGNMSLGQNAESSNKISLKNKDKDSTIDDFKQTEPICQNDELNSILFFLNDLNELEDSKQRKISDRQNCWDNKAKCPKSASLILLIYLFLFLVIPKVIGNDIVKLVKLFLQNKWVSILVIFVLVSPLISKLIEFFIHLFAFYKRETEISQIEMEIHEIKLAIASSLGKAFNSMDDYTQFKIATAIRDISKILAKSDKKETDKYGNMVLNLLEKYLKK